MKAQNLALGLAILALFVTPTLHAAPDQHTENAAFPNKGENTAAGMIRDTSEPIGQPSQELIKQKLQLVKMLLAKSPALERASRNDNTTTKQLAGAAAKHYANAVKSLNSGELVRANELLDEALRLIEDVSRLAPDPQEVAAEQRTRYAKLLEGVRSIQFSYQDLRHRLTPKDTVSPATLADLERVRGLVGQAQTFAATGRYREAGDLLKTAHAMVVSALNKLPASTAVPYEFKFETAAEEFDYEVARYHSYEELAPIAYAELKPGEASINLSERYVKESHATLDAAKKQASTGDYSTAISTLQNAIKQLQTALQAVGVIVPE